MSPPEELKTAVARTTSIFRVLALTLAIGLTGCPTYDDEYTGHFQEVLEGERLDCFERRTCDALTVDFFRFGDFSQAIVRQYTKGLRNTVETPFVEESGCFWTSADRFDSDGQSFNMVVDRQGRNRSVVRGELDDDGLSLNLEIVEPQTTLNVPDRSSGPLNLALERIDGEPPTPRCDSVHDFILIAQVGSSMPEETGYTINSPVFSLVWVGFERLESAGGVVFFPTRSSPKPWWRFLDGTITSGGRGLRGSVNLQVSPPDERFLTRSGSTRYALAHMLVVDDFDDDPERFTWDVEQEPLIAMAFRRGLPSETELEIDEPQHGQALLFVEGELDQLDPVMQDLITNFEDYPYGDAHYFLVDVIADGDEIIRITLPEERRPPTPIIRVTDRYLDSQNVALPRIFPFNSF